MCTVDDDHMLTTLPTPKWQTYTVVAFRVLLSKLHWLCWAVKIVFFLLKFSNSYLVFRGRTGYSLFPATNLCLKDVRNEYVNDQTKVNAKVHAKTKLTTLHKLIKRNVGVNN